MSVENAAVPWVELRVHGVSGTPPESMLAAARVEQVAGDQDGRFFRGIDNRGALLRGDHGEEIEAFHWGRATSGSAASAFWFLLAPFGIVNAAGFMLPMTGSKLGDARAARGGRAVARAALRLLGLGLTVLLTVSVSVILLDLWAWQKPGGPTTWVSLLAIAGSAVFVLGCFGLARNRHDVCEPSQAFRSDGPSRFTTPEFLQGDPDAPVLRSVHLAAGLLTVAVLAAPLGPPTRELHVTRLVALVSLGLLAAVTIVLGDRPWGRFAWIQSWSGVAFYAASLLSSIPLLFTLFLVLTGPGSLAPGNVAESLPDAEPACFAVMVWCCTSWIVLLISNAVVAWSERHRESPDRFRPFAGGMAATLVSGLAIFVAVGYAGALGTAAAKALEAQPSVPEDYRVVAPGMLSRAVYAWGVMTCLLILVGLVVLFWLPVASPRRRRAQAAEPFEAYGAPLPASWLTRVARAIGVARLKNHLVGLLASATAVGCLLSVFAAWGELSDLFGWAPPPTLLTYASTAGAGIEPLLMEAGTALLGLVAVRLALLGRSAARNTTTRRGLNVIWDVIAFWPRSSHPFVPPPYARGTIRRLTDRVEHHLESSRGPVVLCGHSQGSLISLATLVRLLASMPRDCPDRRRLGLVTFGSQLQVLFARSFPGYVNFDVIKGLHHDLGARWVNLYRDTDHVAGPVLSWRHTFDACEVSRADWIGGAGAGESRPGRREFGPDWRLADPPVPDQELQVKPLLPLRKHGDYWLDDAWDDAVAVARGYDLPAAEATRPTLTVCRCWSANTRVVTVAYLRQTLRDS
ncbi:hypothetical protein [Actinomycetospora atypica]|uniref:Integral membrane protein n=1 Tax=Actinomycetospora atypica TaxID=1290095 RepID=A0ABV9YHV7_9PSEU